MQFVEVIHLVYMFKDRLQLVNHVHIAYQNDEVVDICDYNHNIVVNLQNIQLVLRMAPYGSL